MFFLEGEKSENISNDQKWGGGEVVTFYLFFGKLFVVVFFFIVGGGDLLAMEQTKLPTSESDKDSVWVGEGDNRRELVRTPIGENWLNCDMINNYCKNNWQKDNICDFFDYFGGIKPLLTDKNAIDKKNRDKYRQAYDNCPEGRGYEEGSASIFSIRGTLISNFVGIIENGIQSSFATKFKIHLQVSPPFLLSVICDLIKLWKDNYNDEFSGIHMIKLLSSFS